MERCEWFPIISKKYPDLNVRSEIDHTLRKIKDHIGAHYNVMISVSGGSDYDCIIHLICTYFPEYLEKCNFVFVNTGLEYAATKRHLKEQEKRYGITIDQIRGKSVVYVVKKYGVPILSKEKSQYISDYLRGYSYAIKAINKKGRFGFTNNQRKLIEYIKTNKIQISKKCCDISKKKPVNNYIKKHGIDLNVTGERKAEGGIRANSHKSCFEEHKTGISKYMPLWWWSDETKAAFKAAEGIRFSDCYEVYGMKRTGCCGCPFSLDIADNLQAMFEYEPQLYKACMHVFGISYELMDKFKCRRKKCLPEYLQMPLLK